MRFQVVSIEPRDYKFGHFLDDLCRMISYGLESLGHDCTLVRNSVDPTRCNILVGAHMLRSPQDVQAIASSAPYIVLQTEMINPTGVNLSNNSDHLQQVYLPLLRRASAVWETFRSNIESLKSHGIPAQLVLGGYHPRLDEIPKKRQQDIDFLFFGSITPHRREMLQRLQQRGNRVVIEFDARATFRNDLIARTKVHLSPRQGNGMDQLPWQRVCYLLNNRSIVAVERSREQEWIQDCFAWSETRYWVDLCEQVLARPDRDHLAERYYEKYRQMPITEQLERILDEMQPPAALAG